VPRLGAVTSANPSPVGLIAVDDVVLEQLVHAAVSDASADDVTPPLGAGAGWTPARVGWLETFHRDRRAGLGGAAAEATWAVVVGSAVVGSVRLKSTDEPGVLETGVWLTRSSRGRGIGGAAMAAVLQEAAALGAQGVRADTTAGNTSALGVLHRLGFDVEVTDGEGVRALLLFDRDGRTGSAGAHDHANGARVLRGSSGGRGTHKGPRRGP
jgi:RimJ/RimL family protein N-acetyltransferase